MTPTADRKSQPVALRPAARLDAGLLLTRLEEKLLSDDASEQARAILRKEALWQKLGIPDRLRWAQLSQMAEMPAVARAVLESVHRQDPACGEAWRQHLELLRLLDHREALAALLQRARPHIGAQACERWIEGVRQSQTDEEADLRAAAEPFEQRQRHDGHLHRFLTLFAGRQECFARQWADRATDKQGYVPERRPLGPADVQEHLLGRKTYGIYLMRADGRVRLAVLDADLKKTLRGGRHVAAAAAAIRREAAYLVTRVKELSQSAGAFPLVEFSGAKGYHFWYFFEQPVDPGAARAALGRLAQQVAPDLSAFDLEVFPKQDQPSGKGLGNLVKLPLGVHRRSGKRSFFVECADRSTAAQLLFLASARYCDAGKMFAQLAAPPAAQVVMHPRWQQWAERYPALYRLQSCCAPLAQVMALCLDSGRLSLREEKILYQTIGFLPAARELLHYLFSRRADYNSHQVDYCLSRLRGTPLGCRRIHELLGFGGQMCRFDSRAGYAHPLLHIAGWRDPRPVSEKATDLNGALMHLKSAIVQVERFLK